MNILVTGGLGFIGSHTAVSLLEAGFTPILLDNLSNSNPRVRSGIEKITGEKVEFIEGDVNDTVLCETILKKKEIEGVIHFAAHKSVNESIEKAVEYYHNNVSGLISLLLAMKRTDVNNLVFSSSCTVYGEPDIVPVNEESPIRDSTTPYGSTKQVSEKILGEVKWCNTQCLRYFNPIGAHPSSEIGESPSGIPSNLVPYLTESAAGLRTPLVIHGNDYPTRDGTCIRDFIHVCDLADAHVAAMKRLISRENYSHFETFNIGTGSGHTVLELIKTFQEVTGVSLEYQFGPRRAGDIVKIWADVTKSSEVLKWKASRNLKEMMRDAWNWQKSFSLKNAICYLNTKES